MTQAQKKGTMITIILALIGGGILGEITGVWARLFDREESYRELYRNELRQNNEILDDLRQLKSDLTLLSIIDYEFPFPIWIKDRQGRMVYVNEAYDEQILKTAGIAKIDYIGSEVEEFFPTEIAREFTKNDNIVIRNKTSLRTVEAVEINGLKRYGIVYKFPIIFNNEVRYVAGTWNDIYKSDLQIIL